MTDRQADRQTDRQTNKDTGTDRLTQANSIDEAGFDEPGQERRGRGI